MLTEKYTYTMEKLSYRTPKEPPLRYPRSWSQRFALVLAALLTAGVLAAALHDFMLSHQAFAASSKEYEQNEGASSPQGQSDEQTLYATHIKTTPLVNTLSGETVSSSTVLVKYCSEFVAAKDPNNLSGKTSTDLTFDDAWFTEDGRIYNHGLARCLAVLCAVCNSESQRFNGMQDAEPYAENALHAMGFQGVTTSSYELRSHALDQLGDLVTGNIYEAAYTLAHKQMIDSSGQTSTIVFVGIRGSYGAEWLSNLNLYGQGIGEDHFGFSEAKDGVAQALSDYLASLGKVENLRIVLTGHSRGGAIANLLAAELLENKVVNSKNLFTYTFASPASTRSATTKDELYQGIFNLINPSDIVPKVPLSTWGFSRYGKDIYLPSVYDNNFETYVSEAQHILLHNTGFEAKDNTESLQRLTNVGNELAAHFPDFHSVFSPSRLVEAVQNFVGIDVESLIQSHYPDSYIAWLQAVPANALTVNVD